MKVKTVKELMEMLKQYDENDELLMDHDYGELEIYSPNLQYKGMIKI